MTGLPRPWNAQDAGPSRGSPYVAYSYAYPHKSAYHRLGEPRTLDALWAGEDRRNLFLYVHLPFCEMRCGFCNLFTAAHPPADQIAAHQQALGRQMDRTADALGPQVQFSRMALGGGTPTLLEAPQLEALFDALEQRFDASPSSVPCSVETSPLTATPAKAALLARRGIRRVSIGVQSFDAADARGCGRPQEPDVVFRALDTLRTAAIPVLNLDLIYGIPGQTAASWLATLETALRWQPEELFLYPLYVRPLTGLDRRAGRRGTELTDHDREHWDAMRLELYRLGRDRLLAAGYAQVSMRMFRAAHAPVDGGPDYCCQSDGMVGLGCGARSYTRGLHYSSEFAVSQRGVKAILQDYAARSDDEFSLASYGCELDSEEQQRRWLIQSLLPAEGFHEEAYRQRFGREFIADFPQLEQLLRTGLAEHQDGRFQLTAAGLERSDAIGPWLYSPAVRHAMGGFELR